MPSLTYAEQQEVEARAGAAVANHRRNQRGLREGRALVDKASGRLYSHGERLKRLGVYGSALSANPENFFFRAQRFYRNRYLLVAFLSLLPFAYLFDFGFTFPSIVNGMSSTSLARFFPSLSTWDGQLRLVALFALCAVAVNVIAKLMTETHADYDDLQRADADGHVAKRLRRQLFLKAGFRVVSIALLIGAATHAWFDASTRAQLAARATGGSASANPALLLVLGGSVLIHALLLWFPVALLHRDRLAASFVCPPDKLDKTVIRVRRKRDLAAQALMRAISSVPPVQQAMLIAEIQIDVRQMANDGLGYVFLPDPPTATSPAARNLDEAAGGRFSTVESTSPGCNGHARI